MTETRVMTLDLIKEAMGDDGEEFTEVLAIVQDIIDNPERYHGGAALRYAALLAAYRTKISLRAQYYKTAENKSSLESRRRKDVLMSMYASLEENINCLKLLGRIDAKAAGII